MKALRFLFTGCVAATTFLAQAQTADELATKYVTAIGGADAWRKVQTIKQEGTMTVQGTVKVAVSTTTIQNKGTRVDFEAMGMKGYQIITPTEGWAYSPFAGQTKAEPSTADDVKQGADQLDAQGMLVDYQKKGHTLNLLGKEDVEGVDAYKLQITQKSGKVETVFIDPKTYYIIRTISKQKANGKEMEIKSDLSNYKKLPEGIVLPMSINSAQGDLNIEKVTVNGPVDEAIFKPAN